MSKTMVGLPPPPKNNRKTKKNNRPSQQVCGHTAKPRRQSVKHCKDFKHSARLAIQPGLSTTKGHKDGQWLTRLVGSEWVDCVISFLMRPQQVLAEFFFIVNTCGGGVVDWFYLCKAIIDGLFYFQK